MITLLRHCQSVTNLTHKDMLDPPLSKLGFKDAESLNGNYDFILISPLQRTKQTYLYSNIIGTVVEFSSLARERRGTHAHLSKTLKDEKGLIESEEDFGYRMYLLKLYLHYLSMTHQRILVITHHAVIMYLSGQNAHNCEYIIL